MCSKMCFLLSCALVCMCTVLIEASAENKTAVKVKSPMPAKGKEKEIKSDGQVCVMNTDCESKCCIYATAISGRCMPKAPIGLVCGFVLAGSTSFEDHYRMCEECDTFCCCGSGCCPTSYCVSALSLKPAVCTSCHTGCCCSNDACCPVPYCAVSPGLHEIQGEPCQRCPSGCCCGDSCCLSSFCKGSIIGQFCQTCGSGCCCGILCCAVSFCDSSALSMTRLLSLYGGAPNLPSYLPFDKMSLAFPKPVDVNQAFAENLPPSSLLAAYLPMLNMNVGLENQQAPQVGGYPCLDCTTGCCCNFGCCNSGYCTQ